MVKRQRLKGNLESSKGEEATHHMKVILNKINKSLILRNCRGQKAIRLYTKSAERKRMSTNNKKERGTDEERREKGINQGL